MITYVNTVLVSNLATGAVLSAAPAAAPSVSAASADAGKFIVVADDEATAVAKTNAANFDKIKVGVVTKNNTVLRKRDGSIEYRPIVKWSNAIQKGNIKSYSTLTYAADTEDVVTITFTGINETVLATLAKDFIWDKWLKKGTFELADIYCGVVGSFIGFWFGFLSQHI